MIKPSTQSDVERAIESDFAMLAERIEAIEALLAPPPPDPDPLAGLKRGRVVYYHPHPHEARNADAGPWTAIVTNVGPQPGEVTLAVMPPVPLSLGADPVTRRNEVPFSASGEPGSWAWPGRA